MYLVPQGVSYVFITITITVRLVDHGPGDKAATGTPGVHRTASAADDGLPGQGSAEPCFPARVADESAPCTAHQRA